MFILFSHSLPVVVYNFGQVQRTSQVESKTKCSKKTYSRPLDCFVKITEMLSINKTESKMKLIKTGILSICQPFNISMCNDLSGNTLSSK